MNRTRKNEFRAALLGALALAAALLVLAGCGPQKRTAGGALDTAEHHTLRGNDLMDAGDWAGAKREFDLGLSLDPKYSQALAGKAVVTANDANAPGLSASKREDIHEDAEGLYEKALSEAKTPADTRVAHTAAMRVHTITQLPQDWLDEARDHYDDAVDTEGAGQDPNPDFYRARAERTAFQLPAASTYYQRVLSLNRGKTKEADEELATVQKVIRAQPGSRYGRIVAFLEQVNRADMAALFIGELQLARLYTRGNQPVDNSFRPPDQGDFQTEQVVRAPEATDIAEHPLKTDIDEIIRLRVSGLEPDPAHRFNPNKPVTRGEFALMVEGILVRVTGETGLQTRFIGQKSPFPDVREDLFYYNAVQTVVSRNLMDPKDKVRGLFKPSDPVTGAEALLVIRLLRDELASFLRS
jgi:tetratricopeptide (TPR) repeat protein